MNTNVLEAPALRPVSDPPRSDLPPPYAMSVVGRRTGGRTVIAVHRGDEPTLSEVLDLASSRARGKLVGSIRAADPQLTDDDLAMFEAFLIRLSTEDSRHVEAAVPSREGREGRAELVARRDERAREALGAMSPESVLQAERLLSDAGILDRIAEDIAAVGVVGEERLAMLLYLVGTSRLLDEPLSAIVQGPSSSGKSFVLDRVADLFPPDEVLRATDLTPQALYYGPEDSLLHSFVVAGEKRRGDPDEHAEATRALRELISSKRLSKAVTVKTPTGGLETKLIEREGPAAFAETTSQTRLFDEDANRALLLATDESTEQTERILRESARRAAGLRVNDDGIARRHHAIQRMIQCCRVCVPFAERLSDAIPSSRPEARRAFPLLLAVIKSVSLLRQRQRAAEPPRHGDPIEATIEDYAVARGLVADALGRALGADMSGAVARFGSRLVDEWVDREFTAAEAAANDSSVRSQSKVREYLRVLVESGCVACIEPGRGNHPGMYRIVSAPSIATAEWLPPAEALRTPSWRGSSGRRLGQVTKGDQFAPDVAFGRDPPTSGRHGRPGSSDSALEKAPTRQPEADQGTRDGNNGDCAPKRAKNLENETAAPSNPIDADEEVRRHFPEAVPIPDEQAASDEGGA